VAKERINTLIDFAAAGEHGVSTEGTSQFASLDALGELGGLVLRGELEVPIAATYPLEQVREAYEELGARTTRGKIVLLP